MSFIAQYAILSDYPYQHRSEHVHIGIVVFCHDGETRVHLGANLRKMKALYPRADMDVIRSWEKELNSTLHKSSYQDTAAHLAMLGNDWRLGETVGKFLYDDENDYLVRVRSALRNLVDPIEPRRPTRESTSRLFLDLKKTFSFHHWLGKDINAHQIVPRFPVGPEVNAEFALKNGRLHVIESLDLRVSNPYAKRTEAQAKALAFDMARRLDKHAASYAVMAGLSSPIAEGTRELLSAYADRVYAWESPSDMSDLFESVAHAVGRPMLKMPDLIN